jgi:penicillin amidase
MRSAFARAVAHLSRQLGGSPSGWTWGRLHRRQFRALTGTAALGYGPRAAGGDPFTVDAAYGGLVATAGPSWRMIARWTGAGAGQRRPVAEGIYPGGQSENPASPWYENLVADWWAGRYLPVPFAAPVRRPRPRPRRQGSSSGPGAAGRPSDVGAGRGSGHGQVAQSSGSAGSAGPGSPGAGSPGSITWELRP